MQVVYRSVFYEATGYGNASRELALAMDQLGLDVKIEAIGRNDGMVNEDQFSKLRELQNKPLRKNRVLLTVEYHQNLQDRKRYRNAVTLAMWETSKVPSEFRKGTSHFRAAIVPSHSSRNAYVNGGVRIPVHVVPLGVNSNVYSPEGVSQTLSDRQEDFVFLSVFGWSERKAPETLLKAYLNEFTDRDPVTLYIKTHGMNVSEFPMDWYNQIVRTVNKPNLPRVKVVSGSLTDQEMAAIYRGADCFVLPTRGEAFGLTILESMACGTPVIVTGWGGHTEFLTASVGYLIPYELVPAKPLHYTNLYTGEQLWANADIGALACLMRQVYTMSDEEVRTRTARGREKALQLSWKRSAEQLISVLKSVLKLQTL